MKSHRFFARPLGSVTFMIACIALLLPTVYADDWPQWRGLNRDGVWHETGIIEAFEGPRCTASTALP